MNVSKLAALEKKLEEQNAVARKTQLAIDQLKEKELIPSIETEYVGRCFVYRNGDGMQRWNLYRKITGVEHVWIISGGKPSVQVKLFEFESYPVEHAGGVIFNVSTKADFPLGAIGEEITENRFRSEFERMVQKFSDLLPAPVAGVHREQGRERPGTRR